MMTGRYVNPYTDFGFKLLFGTPVNKDLLIGFLNALFRGEQEITDVTYLNAEQLGRAEWDRKAVFDVYCENVKGERFIVEMQKARQKYFKDRVFRTTIPRNVRVAEAPSHGVPVGAYDKFSKGAKAYKEFAREVEERTEQA